MGEQKENSLRRLWARLQQRDRWPRRWWYPPAPVAVPASGDNWRDLYKDTSDTIRRAMLALLAVSFYCLLVAFGTPDTELLVQTAPQNMPLIGARVSFGGILLAVPALLLAITGYLHLFLGHLLRLKLHASEEMLKAGTPTLFNLDHPLARTLSHFIFYWLTPVSVTALAWKAMGRPEWSIPALWSVSLTVAWLLWLQIRRCPAERRKWFSPAVFAVIGLLLGGAAYGTDNAFLRSSDSWVHRPLYLNHAQLKEAWLPNTHLAGADLTLANLQGAQLNGANLEGADLQQANLAGADLTLANLAGADLQYANLQGADLRRAKNLTCDQLIRAVSWEGAYRDPELACGAEIQEPKQ